MDMKVWIFLGIEHGMLLFKYGLETLINDTPSDVDIQLRRNDFLVSKVNMEVVDNPAARLPYCSTQKVWTGTQT